MDSKSVRRLAPTALYALLVSSVRNNLLSFYLLHHRVNTRWSERLNLVRLTSIEPYYGSGSHFPLSSFRITAVTLLSCTAYVRCSSCHCITFLADSWMKVASILDHDQQRCLKRGVVTSTESFFFAWVVLHWRFTTYQPLPLRSCALCCMKAWEQFTRGLWIYKKIRKNFALHRTYVTTSHLQKIFGPSVYNVPVPTLGCHWKFDSSGCLQSIFFQL